LAIGIDTGNIFTLVTFIHCPRKHLGECCHCGSVANSNVASSQLIIGLDTGNIFTLATFIHGPRKHLGECCHCGSVANFNVASSQLVIGIGTGNIFTLVTFIHGPRKHHSRIHYLRRFLILPLTTNLAENGGMCGRGHWGRLRRSPCPPGTAYGSCLPTFRATALAYRSGRSR